MAYEIYMIVSRIQTLRLTSRAGILVPLSTSQVEHFVEYCLEFPFRRVDFFFEGRKFPFDKVVFALRYSKFGEQL